MSKIWKVTFNNTFGSHSYPETKFFYTEKEMMKLLTKLKVTSGTIEIFESDDQKLSIDSYLESIKREVQLVSLLEVADEKSVHHSKFIEILSKSKIAEKNDILKEWEFLPKTDDAELKKFFSKYRNIFLLQVTDTVEWYYTLLKLYTYAKITNHSITDWVYIGREYVKTTKVVREVTDVQVNNYNKAKKQIKNDK